MYAPRAALAASLAFGLLLASCAPGARNGPETVRPPIDEARLSPVERTAWEAWLLMEVQRLRSGLYSTQALLDLSLPSGVRWTVVAFSGDDYALVVTGDDDDQDGLRVTPDGVRPAG